MDHSGVHVRMAQRCLDRAHVVAGFRKEWCKGTKCMTGGALAKVGGVNGLRVSLVVEENESCDPVDAGVLRLSAVLLRAGRGSYPIQQPRLRG